MKLLYGTSNPSKLWSMKKMLDGLDIEIIGLKEIDLNIALADENGNSPLENAKMKALEYYKATKMPVFSCDSGLYIEGLDSKKQPGVHVRRVNGKILNDEEMIEYYSNIALELGGEAIAKYKNAICLVINEERIFEYDGDDISGVPFIITSKPHEKRDIGFPLNSLSVEIKTKRYYMDIEFKDTFKNKDEMKESFRSFFLRSINK